MERGATRVNFFNFRISENITFGFQCREKKMVQRVQAEPKSFKRRTSLSPWHLLSGVVN